MKFLTGAVFSLLLGGVLGASAQAQVIECQGVGPKSGAQVEFRIIHETGFYFLNSEPQFDDLACAKDEEDTGIHICYFLIGADDRFISSWIYILDEANGRLTSVSVVSLRGETAGADTWTLDGLSCR